MTDDPSDEEPIDLTEVTEVRGKQPVLGAEIDRGPVDLSPQKAPLDPVGAIPLALAVAAALMLLGAILFALASASSTRVGSADRFRLLGAAAGPVTALVALTAMVLVVEDRARQTGRVLFGPVAAGIATAVSLAVVLLGINGVLTDLTGHASAVFRLSSLVTRLAPILLAGMALWLSISGPGATARGRRRTPPAGGG